MDHQWAPEDVEAHMAFLRQVKALLQENGEYVDGQALTQAQTWVRYGGPDAAPRRPTPRPPVAPRPSPSATTSSARRRGARR
jgi:hypothetical protein